MNTEEIDDILSAVEDLFSQIRLCVWTPMPCPSKASTGEWFVGYTKILGNWCLATRTDNDEARPLFGAPQEIRFAAASALKRLAEALIKETKKKCAEMEEAKKEVEEAILYLQQQRKCPSFDKPLSG